MILIIDFGSSKVPNIENAIRGLGYKVGIKKWDSDIEMNGVRGIILSGAPVLLSKIDGNAYLQKMSFLKTIDIPVLGICFGHQLIGLLYGSTVFLGKENRKDTPIKFTNNCPLFKGMESPAVFNEDHTEGIALPDDFILTAQSEDYTVEAMQHKTKPFYGVQFHPEVSGKNGEVLLNNFCSSTI